MSRTTPVSASDGSRGNRNPWNAATAWLGRVPVEDPVDRRNAPMLQVVLLILATHPPLMWAYRLFAVDVPWRAGETLGLVLSLALSALAIFSFVLIRRGRLQWAVRQLMVVVAVLMMLSYLGTGFTVNRFEQPVQVIWLVISGLMIGRRALWLMYGWIVLTFAAGGWAETRADASEIAAVIGDVAISASIFLLIAVAVDRSVAALRESLHAATRRGNELAQANRLLQAEIVERERVQDQLIHAQKMEAVGRLSSGVAHDFNHLLGLIQGYATRGKRAGDDDGMRKALDGVDSAARRAAAVANKLLNFSRQDITAKEVFDACAALRDMQPMLRQLFDPGIRIDFDLPASPCTIHFDRAQFDLMVLNIAANAGDAMADGGRFTVVVRERAEASGRVVEIEFGDTGHGMSDDVRARFLEPFFTTKPVGEGTGLGLAVVAGLVEDAGGAIALDSALGEGARLRVRLPVVVVARPEVQGRAEGLGAVAIPVPE